MKPFQELINGDMPVLVDFYADWCSPCRAMEPIVREVAREMSDKVKTIKINVDTNQQAAQAYSVSGIPTLILFHHGKVVWRQSGMLNKSNILYAIGQHVV